MIITLAAFATSVLIDVFWGALISPSGAAAPQAGFLYRLGFVLEDIPKFGGICVLASFAFGEAFVKPKGHPHDGTPT